MRESESEPRPGGRKVPTVLIAGVICLSVLTACSQEPVDSRSSGPGILDQEGLLAPDLAEADALRNLGRYMEAGQLYQRIVQAEPENAAARFGLAESLYELGEYDAALKAYQTVEEEPEYAGRALQGQGLIYLSRGDVVPARGRLMAATVTDPLLWRAWNGLGRVHDIAEEYEQAEEAYVRAMEIQPRSALPVNNLGMSLIQQRRFEEAEGRFVQAIQLDPDFRPARANLRNALAWQGRYREALFNVPQGDLPATLNDVGYIAMLNGDLDIAEALFTRAIDESPSYNVQAAENLRYLESLRNRDKPLTE